MALPPNIFIPPITDMSLPLIAVTTPQFPPIAPPPINMPPDAKAFFSTFGGQFQPREALPRKPIILRSFPDDDRNTMVAEYQIQYPEFCKTITHPITTSDLYDYFDGEGIHMHGYGFLIGVLRQIATINLVEQKEIQNQQRKLQKEDQDRQENFQKDVLDFAKRWIKANQESFSYLDQPVTADYGIKELFTQEDIEDHAEDFLLEAATKIRNMRLMDEHHRKYATPSLKQDSNKAVVPTEAQKEQEIKLQEQKNQTIKNKQNSVYSRDGLQGYPSNQGTRAFSGLERVQHDSRSQNNTPRRGDFHSDPPDRGVGGTGIAYNPGVGGFTVMPPPAHPGPLGFGYQHQPYQIGRASLVSRQVAVEGNYPRGRKNPAKKTSDDVRRESNTSTSGRSAFSRGPSGNWQQVRSPDTFRSYSGPQVQPFSPNPQSGSNWPPQNENSNGTPNLQAGAQQLRSGGQYYGQGLFIHNAYPFMPETAIGPGRYITNPYGSMLEPAIGQSEHAHNVSSSTSQPYVQNEIVVDPHAFGNRLPGFQLHTISQTNPELDSQRTALASIPNAGQDGARRSPEKHGLVTEDCKIWIGGLPKNVTHDALIAFLQQCPGFISTTTPMTKTNNPDVSFCFVESVVLVANPPPLVVTDTELRFQNSSAAEEALTFLPQSQLPRDWMPNGRGLSVGRPKIKDSSPPHSRHPRHSSTQNSPMRSRNAGNTVIQPERAYSQGPSHSRRKSGGSQQHRKLSVTRGNDFNILAELVDPAIISSRRQLEGPASEPDHFAKTDHFSQGGSATELGGSNTEEQSPGPTNSIVSVQRSDIAADTAPSHIPEAANSPSALDGSPEAATSSNNYSPNKQNKSKANSSKKLSISENKKGEPSRDVHHPEQNLPLAGGKITTRNNHGQNVKAKDRKIDSKTNPAKGSSSTTSPVTGTISPSIEGESQSFPSATNREKIQHDVKSVTDQKHANSAPGHAKHVKATNAPKNDTLKTTARPAEVSQGQKAPSQAMSLKASTPTHDRAVSISSALVSTTATSPVVTARLNSIVEDMKSSRPTPKQAPIPSVDPVLLRDKLEDQLGGMDVTQPRNERSVKRDSGQKGQATPVESTPAGIVANTASGHRGNGQSNQIPFRGRKDNRGLKGQKMPKLPTAMPGQSGNSTPDNLISESPQVKGNFQSKMANTEVNSGARPSGKTSKNIDVFTDMESYSNPIAKVDEVIDVKKVMKPNMKTESSSKPVAKVDEVIDVKKDMKPNMKMDVKTDAEAVAKTSAADTVRKIEHTVKESHTNETRGGQFSQQKGMIPVKTPKALATDMSPQPSPSASGNLSPERKQPPEIPERSSSLAVVSTPIKTHSKKKPKTFLPKEEAEIAEKAISDEQTSDITTGHASAEILSGNHFEARTLDSIAVTNSFIRTITKTPQKQLSDEGNDESSLTLRAATSTSSPSKAATKPDSTISELTRMGQKIMPKPETFSEDRVLTAKHVLESRNTFLDNKEGNLPAPNPARQKDYAAIADYYREKALYQDLYLQGALKSDIPLSQYKDQGPSSEDLFSPSSLRQQDDMYDWRKCGYHELSDSHQLERENPVLARLSQQYLKKLEAETSKGIASLITTADFMNLHEEPSKKGEASLITTADFMNLHEELRTALGSRSAEEQGAKDQAASPSRLTSTKKIKNDVEQAGQPDEAGETQIEQIDGSQYSCVPRFPFDPSRWSPIKDVDTGTSAMQRLRQTTQEPIDTGLPVSEELQDEIDAESSASVAPLFAGHAEDTYRFDVPEDWLFFYRDMTGQAVDDINNGYRADEADRVERANDLLPVVAGVINDTAKESTATNVEKSKGRQKKQKSKSGKKSAAEEDGAGGLPGPLVQRDISTVENLALAGFYPPDSSSQATANEKGLVRVEQVRQSTIGLGLTESNIVNIVGDGSGPLRRARTKSEIRKLEEIDQEMEELEKEEQQFQKRKQERAKRKQELVLALAGLETSRSGGHDSAATESTTTPSTVEQVAHLAEDSVLGNLAGDVESGLRVASFAGTETGSEELKKSTEVYESPSSGPTILTPPSNNSGDRNSKLLSNGGGLDWEHGEWEEEGGERHQAEDAGKSPSKTTPDSPKPEKSKGESQGNDAGKGPLTMISGFPKLEKDKNGSEHEDAGITPVKTKPNSPKSGFSSADVSDDDAVANCFPSIYK